MSHLIVLNEASKNYFYSFYPFVISNVYLIFILHFANHYDNYVSLKLFFSLLTDDEEYLGTACGSYLPPTLCIPEAEGGVKITFHSDSSGPGSGFRFEYWEEPIENPEGKLGFQTHYVFFSHGAFVQCSFVT